MKLSDRKLKGFVNRLLELSKTDGLVDASKVETVIEGLRKARPARRRAILEAYLAEVKRDLHRSTAKVEYAGALQESSLQALHQGLERQTGRKLDLQVDEDSSLIAGVRVSVGDYVYDRTIRSIVDRLSPIS